MIAEYLNYGDGPPPGDLAWPLVLLAVDRTGRFESRRRLTLMEAVADGIGAAMGGDPGATDHHREELRKRAYPVKGRMNEFLPNLAAPPEEDGDDEGGADGG